MTCRPDALRIGEWLLWRVEDDGEHGGAIWIQHAGGEHSREGGTFDEAALAELISKFYAQNF